MDASANSEESRSTNSRERTGDGSTSGSSQPSGATGDDDNSAIKRQLTKKGTKAVFRTRMVVVSLLLAAAASLTITAFFVTRKAEKEEFDSQYEGVANKVIQSFENIFVEISAVSGLGVALTAHSVDHKSEWPFVTLSNFHQRAGNARELSGSLGIQVTHVVPAEMFAQWEEFVRSENNTGWIDDSAAFLEAQGLNDFVDPERVALDWLTDNKVDPMHYHDELGQLHLTQSEGPYSPIWQMDPFVPFNIVNENRDEGPLKTPQKLFDEKVASLGGLLYIPAGSPSDAYLYTAFTATLLSIAGGREVEHQGDPMTILFLPVFDTFDVATRKTVASLSSTVHWRSHFENILPSSAVGITVVLEHNCSGYFTYEIHGSEVYVKGQGDKHQSDFSEYRRDGTITVDRIKDGTLEGIKLDQEGCTYSIHVYPTQQYYDSFLSNGPAVVSAAVALVFALTISMFFVYDRLVERRQQMVLAKATQSTAIVSSLFPKQVRDRLMATEPADGQGGALQGANSRLKSFLNGSAPSQTNGNADGSQPIADLFPNCTVFFADISGFTAWSSTREPAQVFILLQSVYQAFDMMAKKRKVFKVETIGDSYVAVTGLPEPQSHHATIMAKFAWECLRKVHQITKELEVQLGPDTGELDMRFGLHSGPVTAGVLKGDRARFQLFGDTVNTASRMESTGQKGKIQVSQSTAAVLTKAGKESWLTPREDVVKAKGKGVLKTFWVSLQVAGKQDSGELSDEDYALAANAQLEQPISAKTIEKEGRLVEWTVDILLEHIRKMVNVRDLLGVSQSNDSGMVYGPPDGTICLDEIKDAIPMPRYDTKVSMATEESSTVVVPRDIVKELKDYVSMIATSYRHNPFHNFEHACHVTMSATKLLKRVVAPGLTGEEIQQLKHGMDETAAKLHKFSHGIASDPLASFALTFAALIHDVDHQGIPNGDLCAEEPEMGKHYRNKCVAEQNSLDVAWDILMSEKFRKLRKYIFSTEDEMMRFRQLLVNMVLATDLFDEGLADKRRNRWDLAFNGDGDLHVRRFNDYRATVVMEHIIQAADISHCMQHWHVYQKWNRKLFKELYTAYKGGRVEVNPGDYWYEGELEFYDKYVIPLAEKLIQCDASGVNGDEYLNYASLNRAEWQDRGQDVVADFLKELGDTETPASSKRSVNAES